MQADEVAEFEAQDGWRAAVALRRYDDLGKEHDRVVPGLGTYRDLVLGLLIIA